MNSHAFIGSVATFACRLIAKRDPLRLWEPLIAIAKPTSGKRIIRSNGVFNAKHLALMLVLLHVLGGQAKDHTRNDMIVWQKKSVASAALRVNVYAHRLVCVGRF